MKKMKYGKKDGVLLRRQDRSPSIEAYIGGKWSLFPEDPQGDIRHSAVANWYEATPLTEKDVEAKIASGQY